MMLAVLLLRCWNIESGISAKKAWDQSLVVKAQYKVKPANA
jgi:hypothetical protein